MTVAGVAATLSSHTGHMAGRAVLGVAWLATLGGMGDRPRHGCSVQQELSNSTAPDCWQQTRSMDEQSSGDDGTQTAGAKRRAGGRPFQRGQDARRNLKGRKQPRQALAAVIRRCADPQQLVATMLAIINNPKTATRDRIAAFVALADRGWARPERTSKVDVAVSVVPPGWQSLPTADRLAYLEQMRLRAALPAGTDAWEDDDAE